MIVGKVNARLEAIICLAVRGPNGATESIDALIDTGFTGALTLPAPVVANLNLVLQMTSYRQLADGSQHQFNVYEVEVEWAGVWSAIPVLETNGTPLVGMALLRGHELCIDVRLGGSVMIAPIAAVGENPG